MNKTNVYITFIILFFIASAVYLGFRIIVLFQQFGIIFLIPLAIIIIAFATHNYFWKKWQKNKQDKILSNYPFNELITKGFIIEDNKDKKLKSINGTINGFHIIIVFLDIGVIYSELAYIIEFHPKLNNQLLSNEDLELLISKYKKEKFIWKFHSVISYKKQYKNSDFTILIPKIEETIKILKAENIKPISQSEIDAIKPEIDNFIEARTWDRKFV